MLIPFMPKTKSEDETASTVAWLESCYKSADMVRRKFEPDWMTNITYLAGNQWETANQDIRRYGMRQERPVNTSARVVINKILPLVRQAASSLQNAISVMEAVPASPDDNDVKAAILATKFLKHQNDASNEQDKRYREMLWAMACGRSWRKTTWNPDASGINASGRLVPGIGDISSEVISPFMMHCCPWGDDYANPLWVIETDVRDVDEINAMYPNSKDDIKPEGLDRTTYNIDKLAVNIIDEIQNSTTEQRKHAAMLKRMYIRGTDDRPKGKLFVWASGQLLYEGDLPDGVFPFVCLDWFHIPGRTYPLPFISPLRDMQKMTNTIASQVWELINRKLRGDIAIRGTGEVITKVQPNGQKVIKMGPGVIDWKFVDYALDTNQANMSIQQAWQDMMLQSGIREMSLGQSAGASTTATQVSLLKESDLEGLQLFKNKFDLRYADVAMLQLINAAKHYTIPRLITVVGSKYNVEAVAFTGSELRSTTDVRPVSKPLVTETQKAQILSELGAQGLFGPFEGPVQKKAAIDRLLISGIPGIEELVEGMVAPASIQEFRQMAGQIEMQQAEVIALNNELQKANITAQLMQLEQAMQPAQQPAVDQNGDPIGSNDLASQVQMMQGAQSGSPTSEGNSPAGVTMQQPTG